MIAPTVLQSLLHLFLPHHCAGCGNDIISEDQLLCLQCIDRLPVTNFHMHANNPVEKIFWGRIPLTHAASYMYFSKDSTLQHLLHQLKYKGRKDIGFFFGKRMGEVMLQSNRFNSIDALVPLPLFAARERKRGYNQASIICDGIAAELEVPVLRNVITRRAATTTQTKKGRAERWQNMEGKFQLLDAAPINNRHILLVDDVVTTGATLEACGHELLKGCNTRLSIFTMAYTLK